MLKKISLALVVIAMGSAAFAQEKKITVADFAGTWNIEVMSHQVALVIEAGEGNHATGTLMMMGRDTFLKGELADRSITFVGVRSEANGNMPAEHGTPGHDHDATPAGSGMPPQPIVVTLQDDGTISGEMMTSNGPMKWTGEKLKAKKQG